MKDEDCVWMNSGFLKGQVMSHSFFSTVRVNMEMVLIQTEVQESILQGIGMKHKA